MPFDLNSKRVCSYSLALVVAAVLGCSDNQSNAPCPKPPGETVPAAETVSVGGVATFAIPTSQLTANRRIQWSSAQPTVATVPVDAGQATARAVGTAAITAIDVNSQANCTDVWVGQLVVR